MARQADYRNTREGVGMLFHTQTENVLQEQQGKSSPNTQRGAGGLHYSVPGRPHTVVSIRVPFYIPTSTLTF